MKPSSSDTRKPYGGSTRSLVIALDVGTTFSGVSYAVLEPGEVPKIHGVTRFPGQEHVAGNSKIPSIIYYDKYGTIKAAGAEAESTAMVALAEDEGWIKTELFKLRLRPKAMKLIMNGMRLSRLPANKNATDVFGDFLSYLFRCTQIFIMDTHAMGHDLWNAVEHRIEFVLSHPNGWEGAQQAKMRRAAIYGDLIPDTDEGKARIRFVTEGEASLHACVLNGLADDVLSNPSKHGFLIADAGGGTLDISSYAIRGSQPLVIEEVAPPDCVFAGSVFVSRRAREFLGEKLKGSKYGGSDSLDHITKKFDETTKRLFRNSKDLQFIAFGSPLDVDRSVGIRGGQLKLTGDEVAELFEPSIEAAVASIRTQIEASGGAIRSVWLVGGFAASPWLFSQLQERLARYHVTVSRPDTQTSKAVADGAIGFYCDHHVSARMSKYMYGVEYLREYDPSDREHMARKDRLCELPSGPSLLPDAFDCILARSVKVKESTVFSRKYCTELTNLSTLSVFEVEIWCYRGGDTIPKWILRHAENFSTLCVVRANLSPLSGSAEPKLGKNGRTYWTIVFTVEIHFGLTEFKARIKWTDNGQTKYGPASIIYSESGQRADEDEPDSSPEDDLYVSSRSASMPASRARSQDSLASGNKTPSGSRPDIAFLEVPGSERSRAKVAPPSVSPPVAPSPPVVAAPHVSYSHTSADSGRGRDLGGTTSSKAKEKINEKSSKSTSKSVTPNEYSDSPVSAKSTGRLADALNAVWGPGSVAGSQAPSPVVEISRSMNGTSGATQRDVPKIETPREVPRVETPREVPRVEISRELPKIETPREVPRVEIPREVPKIETPREAAVVETPRVETPREAPKAAKSKAIPKLEIPKVETGWGSKQKAGTSKAPTPKVATPISRAASKGATPKVETPKETPMVPTPKVETPKAATPKAATPRVATPQLEVSPPLPETTTSQEKEVRFAELPVSEQSESQTQQQPDESAAAEPNALENVEANADPQQNLSSFEWNGGTADVGGDNFVGGGWGFGDTTTPQSPAANSLFGGATTGDPNWGLGGESSWGTTTQSFGSSLVDVLKGTGDAIADFMGQSSETTHATEEPPAEGTMSTESPPLALDSVILSSEPPAESAPENPEPPADTLAETTNPSTDAVAATDQPTTETPAQPEAEVNRTADQLGDWISPDAATEANPSDAAGDAAAILDSVVSDAKAALNPEVPATPAEEPQTPAQEEPPTTELDDDLKGGGGGGGGKKKKKKKR